MTRIKHGSRLPTTDELAEEMMADLLQDRRFQKLWTDMVVDLVLKEQQSASILSGESRRLSNLSRDHTPTRSALADDALDQLIRSLHCTIEVFLRTANLASNDPALSSDLNREFSTLYSIRVQLDRLCAIDEKYDVAKLKRIHRSRQIHVNHEASIGLLSRRFAQVLKSFNVRLSSSYLITNYALFASSLCDMLYRFEEYCSIHLNNISSQVNPLRSAIDDFHSNVVKGLNQILTLKQRSTAQQLISPRFSVTPLSRSTTQLSKSRSMNKLGSPQMSFVLNQEPMSRQSASRKSFILPAELERARRKLHSIGGRSMRNISTYPNKRSGSAPPPLRQTQAQSKRERLKLDFNQQNPSTDIFQIKSGTERQALKQACEFTKEIVEEFVTRVENI
ncbi:hypothetical protein Ddc_11416 [Ditylenchus destructor]|nr:hypothetical protein Ddc_11416 [Ditylenchus destructor]